MKKTIIVCYAEGHCDQVAYALQEYYAKKADEVSLLLINEKQYTSFNTRALKDTLYRFSMRNWPSINKFCGYISYQYNEKLKNKKSKNAKEAQQEIPGEKPEKEESFKKLKTRYRKMDNILLRFNPDVVVCTTPVSLEKALIARERLGSSTQIVVPITDYCTNRGLINNGVDKFIVQNSGIKQTLLAFGIKEENIEIIGTPIVSSVLEKFDKKAVFDELGIVNRDLPVVVIASGRCGSSRIIDGFKDLAPYSNEMNIIIFANKSQNIHSFVKSYVKASKVQQNIYILDSISNMAKIYSIADVLVTSPTASLTYEASVRGIPCVLLKPANLIEEGNFTYLSTNGFAFIGEKTTHLVPAVLALIKKQNPDGTPLKVKTPSEFNAQAYGDFILSVIPADSAEKKAKSQARRKAALEKEIKDEPVDAVVVNDTEKKKKTKSKK